MSHSVPPGDIPTQIKAKIIFNAPNDDKNTSHIKIVNSSARRIGWAIKTTNMKRPDVNTGCGALDHTEATIMAVFCTNNGRITIEWANTHDGAAHSSAVTAGTINVIPSSVTVFSFTQKSS